MRLAVKRRLKGKGEERRKSYGTENDANVFTGLRQTVRHKLRLRPRYSMPKLNFIIRALRYRSPIGPGAF
jgi:hypothetical protein